MVHVLLHKGEDYCLPRGLVPSLMFFTFIISVRPRVNAISRKNTCAGAYHLQYFLGLTLKSAKRFNCSIVDRVKKFYRCSNAIFRIDGHSNDMVMLRLVETHCIPILRYAIEVIDRCIKSRWIASVARGVQLAVQKDL